MKHWNGSQASIIWITSLQNSVKKKDTEKDSFNKTVSRGFVCVAEKSPG